MFGPPPSGPRFPYPYLPVFFPPSPVRTSARFFFSVPVVSPWRSKSPFLAVNDDNLLPAIPAFRSAFLESPFRPLLFLSGARNPRRTGVRSSVLEPRSFPTTGRASGSPPFFPPRRDPSAPAGSVLWSLGVCGRACCPYPHRLFSSPRLPGILFALCSVKPCFPSVFGLSASTGSISSLPLPPECRSGSESEQRPSDNMTCCRPIFGSPDGRPARRGADAAGRLCRRNGMNGCPCDIEEKEKSHNDGYATFVPSCFSGLCFPSSLEMRISGFR